MAVGGDDDDEQAVSLRPEAAPLWMLGLLPGEVVGEGGGALCAAVGTLLDGWHAVVAEIGSAESEGERSTLPRASNHVLA